MLKIEIIIILRFKKKILTACKYKKIFISYSTFIHIHFGHKYLHNLKKKREAYCISGC